MDDEIKCEQVGMLAGGKWDKCHEANRRVYSGQGLSPTITTMGGGQREPKIVVSEASKKGYDTATYGDSINMAYPNSKTRRGRVGHGVAQTLTTGDAQQVVVEPIAYDEQNCYLRQDGCVGTLTTDGSSPKHNNSVVEPILVGGIGEHDFGKQNRQGDRVYSSSGVACALTAQPLGNAGGYSYLYQVSEPRICAMRGRNPDNPSDRTVGSPTEQRLEIGSEETSNTLTTVQKDNLVTEPNYRFFEQALETLRENDCEEGDTIDAYNKRVNKDEVSPTITTRPDGFKTAILPITQDYRIRKLTERECFRLQGVKQEDFERVAKNQSTSSCYHLSGDAICVSVLMAIFGQLFGVDYQTEINELIGELRQ